MIDLLPGDTVWVISTERDEQDLLVYSLLEGKVISNDPYSLKVTLSLDPHDDDESKIVDARKLVIKVKGEEYIRVFEGDPDCLYHCGFPESSSSLEIFSDKDKAKECLRDRCIELLLVLNKEIKLKEAQESMCLKILHDLNGNT